MDEKSLQELDKNIPSQTKVASPTELPGCTDAPLSGSRRKFLGNIGGITVAALTAGAIGLEPLVGANESVASAAVVDYKPGPRAGKSLAYRTTTASAENIDV